MRPILVLLLGLAIPAAASAQRAPAPHPSTRVPYAVVHDTTSGAKLPRLTDPRTPQARAVNRQLDSISADLRCPQRYVRGMKTEHDAEARTTYAADDVLSVLIRFGGDCGGAHPFWVNASVTFDLRTGKPMAFRDLFADYERDAPAIVRALFPAQTAAADRLSPAQVEALDDGTDDFCLQFYTTGTLARETRFAYSLSYDGLVAEPRLDHARVPCVEEAVVPYERLRPFAAPGSILDRVAAARGSQ
jgi:hypothetical protein